MSSCVDRPTFSLPVEEHIVLQAASLDFESQCEAAAHTSMFTDSTYPSTLHEKQFHVKYYGSELADYLLEEDHDPITLARLIREAEYIPDEVMYGCRGVTLPQSCLTFAWIEPFEACKEYDLFALSEHLLQIACDKHFKGQDLKQIEADLKRLPILHPVKQVAPQDAFIAVLLVNMIQTDRNWRDEELTPVAAARVARVEEQLFALPQRKL